MSLWAIEIGPGALGANLPWLAVSALLALLMLLVMYLSYRRLGLSNKARLALVWGLNVCAFVGLSGLLSDVRIAGQSVPSAQLITVNATGSQLRDVDQGQDVFVMRDWALQQPADTLPAGAKVIEDVAQLAMLRPELGHLQVVGDGLSASQWQTFSAIHPAAQQQKLTVSFSPLPRQFGPIDLAWQKQLAPGEYLQISGKLQGGTEAPGAYPAETGTETETSYQLTLLDPSQQLVAQQTTSSAGPFKLTAQTLQPGQWLYRLQVRDIASGDILADEPIAIDVSVQRLPALLIKQSAPSFETRHLKNWASAFGSRVTTVSQISQNSSIVQQLNPPEGPGKEQNSDPFINASLHEYDFLVMDARALSALPAEQVAYLYSAIFHGLGLLIIADDTATAELASVPWLHDIEVRPLEGGSTHYQTLPHWPHSRLRQNIEIPPLKLIAPGAQVLVEDSDKQPLVVANNLGLGKVALSLLNKAYQWQLSGDSNDYSHYWQSLLKQLARGNTANTWMARSHTQLFYAGQDYAICALSHGDSLYLQTDTTISLTADSFQPNKLCSPYWPQAAGWQSLTLARQLKAQDPSAAFELVDKQMNYVYQASDWLAWQQADKHRASQKVASLSPPLSPGQHLAAIGKWYFWWLLFIASSLLWVERKYFS